MDSTLIQPHCIFFSILNISTLLYYSSKNVVINNKSRVGNHIGNIANLHWIGHNPHSKSGRALYNGMLEIILQHMHPNK